MATIAADILDGLPCRRNRVGTAASNMQSPLYQGGAGSRDLSPGSSTEHARRGIFAQAPKFNYDRLYKPVQLRTVERVK